MIFFACDDEPARQSGAKKLLSYTESYNLSGLEFQPQIKVEYRYNLAGRLNDYTVFGYDPETEEMIKQRQFVFYYINNRVDRISGYLTNTNDPYIDYSYQYFSDGRPSRITELNYGTGINSEANFSYNDLEENIRVAYTFSNGGSFEYEFKYVDRNIPETKTTRGEQLCSSGAYTYDDHSNPFYELGYVDYLLTNLCSHNKITECVNYVGCAFPTLIPESYSYEYDEDGYPTTATTFYKSESNAKSIREFTYNY